MFSYCFISHLCIYTGIVALHEYGKESLNDLDAAVSSQSEPSIERMFRHHVLIWELLVALWGSLPEFEGVDGKCLFSTIGGVEEFPTMHHFGFLRNTQLMVPYKNITEYCWDYKSTVALWECC